MRQDMLDSAATFVPPGARLGEVSGRQLVLNFGDPAQEHAALTAGTGLADLSQHTQLELLGRDRALHLHNLCTNDIKRMQPGDACEAFITNVQGRTIGWVQVYCIEDAIVLETSPKQATLLLAHLERYHLREDVAFADRTEAWFQLVLAGPGAAGVLRKLCPCLPDPPLGCQIVNAVGQLLMVRRSNYLGGNCFALSGPREALPSVWSRCVAAGATPCGFSALESARLEAGTPRFGEDITDKNLPQEVDRNARAINFNKGCYLGQETVARLDALGHVNQLLRGLRFSASTVPAAGLELRAEAAGAARGAGRVTSAAWSYRLQAPLALAYVRREFAQPGQTLTSDLSEAYVLQPPIG